MRVATIAGTLVFLGCAGQSDPNGAARPTDVCERTQKGRVTLAVDAEPIVQSRATAVFSDVIVSSQAPRCTTRPVGGCSVTECVAADPPAGLACQELVRTTGAGSISISGGASAPLSMTSDAKRGYAGFSSGGARWTPGDALTITAAGGEVPAFDATLTFPSRVEITGPADYVAKKNPIALDWKTGVPLSWKPGVGRVWLHLFQGDPELRKRTDIECEADATSGSYTIPSDTLVMLEGSRDTTKANATLEIAGRSMVERAAGEYTVIVEAIYREEPRQLVLALDGAPAK
ncbi:MAG: hypothetical protein HYV09_15010 [Deltaproteobacteria bacterium]|nr:hypothetical protein [Deltaproteobacteria bacterium]